MKRKNRVFIHIGAVSTNFISLLHTNIQYQSANMFMQQCKKLSVLTEQC